MRTTSIRILVAAAALVTLGGCAVYPDNAGYASTGVDIYAPVAPPAPILETYGAAPYAGAVWVDGYWTWRNNQHVWTRGRWESARPGYR